MFNKTSKMSSRSLFPDKNLHFGSNMKMLVITEKLLKWGATFRLGQFVLEIMLSYPKSQRNEKTQLFIVPEFF